MDIFGVDAGFKTIDLVGLGAPSIDEIQRTCFLPSTRGRVKGLMPNSRRT